MASVKKDSITRFMVRANGEWADIAMDHATVMIYSSFGSWGFSWCNIGDITLPEFLVDSYPEYLMGKFSGGKWELDYKATVKSLKQHICSERRVGNLSKEVASLAYASFDEYEGCSEHEFHSWLEDCEELSEAVNLYEDPELIVYSVPRELVNFFANLWPVFIEAIRKEPKLTIVEQAVS